ncbi:hypothetical protein I5Q34_29245 [Streptomyces sp. AV19]|uniref:hypothetical protein n=1 Tax=Streptomyces sp. AV19 TaxID=2793068 RepID=UPI0018FEB156|nr:hypothetical protein [Streptomyces sp. AV19]MBH1938297.1 hypothetical protein [Streptomyces sp. AV19]MDG4534936.1 hypothetical protein [Streptomyces sp. AV19]
MSREARPRDAREAWMRDAPAMLRTGLHFAAVRLPAELLRGLAGGDDRARTEEVFRSFGVPGAVIADPSQRRYYALVRPEDACAGTWDGPAVEVLGEDCYLGVPAPYRADPPGVHWLLCPPEGQEDLCDSGALRKLVAAGRAHENDARGRVRSVNWSRPVPSRRARD